MADSTTGSGTDDLQFDRAVEPDASAGKLICAKCNMPVRLYYYHVNGETTCSTCKQTVDVSATGAGKAKSGASMMKALLFGLGGALGGAVIYYAVAKFLNVEIGLIAILIGFMVGSSIRKATGGYGSRRFQVLAAGLTYLAIALAYTPFALEGVMAGISEASTDSLDVGGLVPLDAKAGDTSAVTAEAFVAGAGADPAASDSVATSSAIDTALIAPEQFSATQIAAGVGLGLVGALLMILVLPLVVIFSEMPSGLINMLIIAFGMHQAWSMTRAEQVTITGPYRIGGDAPPAAV